MLLQIKISLKGVGYLTNTQHGEIWHEGFKARGNGAN